MNDRSDRRSDSDANCASYRMIYVNKFNIEYAELYPVSRRDAMQLRLEIETEFLEFVFKNTEGQSRTVNRNVYLLEKIRHAADMILVSVSQNKPLYFLSVVYQIRNVRNDEIDSEHIVAREAESAIDDYDIIAVFEHREVFCDLAETSQCKHFQFFSL